VASIELISLIHALVTLLVQFMKGILWVERIKRLCLIM